MYHMVLLVLDNMDLVHDMLNAWEKAGATGATILESTGLGRVRKAGIRDDMPLMPSISSLMRPREERHRTMFTVVESEELVDAIIEATRNVIGDLNQPNNGVLFVLPVSRFLGLKGARERANKRRP